MSHPTGLLRTLTLVLAILLGSAPASSGAQDEGFAGQEGDGLAFHLVAAGETPDGPAWEKYQFFFDSTAALPPETAHPNPMVVKVMSGSFAFRVGAQDIVVVDPQGTPIPILEPSDNPFVVATNEAGEVMISDQVVMETGETISEVCTTLCVIPPETTVLVEQGSTLHLPGSVTCFLCNISSNTAELMVIAAVPASEVPFSWTQLAGATDLDSPAGTPQAVLNPQPLSAASSALYVGCR